MNASGWSHWKNEGILVFVLVSVGAAGACRGPESEYLMDADRAAIQAVTDSALAIANGSKNWVAFADTYFAPDAVLMPPNHDAIEGRGAIAAWLTTLPPLQDVQWEIRHEAGAGDMAYVQGAYTRTVTLAEANQLFTDYGTFLEVWKRQPEGTWKVAFFASHSTLPASKWMEVEGLGG